MCTYICIFHSSFFFLIIIEYTKNEKIAVFRISIYSRDESPSKGGNDVFLRRRFSSVSENLQQWNLKLGRVRSTMINKLTNTDKQAVFIKSVTLHMWWVKKTKNLNFLMTKKTLFLSSSVIASHAEKINVRPNDIIFTRARVYIILSLN